MTMTTQTAHFEIVPTRPNVPTIEETFSTYEEAFEFITNDPLLSASPMHPFWFGNFFEIVLCGGDGCTK